MSDGGDGDAAAANALFSAGDYEGALAGYEALLEKRIELHEKVSALNAYAWVFPLTRPRRWRCCGAGGGERRGGARRRQPRRRARRPARRPARAGAPVVQQVRGGPVHVACSPGFARLAPDAALAGALRWSGSAAWTTRARPTAARSGSTATTRRRITTWPWRTRRRARSRSRWRRSTRRWRRTPPSRLRRAARPRCWWPPVRARAPRRAAVLCRADVARARVCGGGARGAGAERYEEALANATAVVDAHPELVEARTDRGYRACARARRPPARLLAR